MMGRLALLKPFEYALRNGEVKIDVSAQEQFGQTVPVVRRVKLDDIHVVATFDPLAQPGTEGRPIKVGNFDGHQGLTVSLPNSSDLRVSFLREQP